MEFNWRYRLAWVGRQNVSHQSFGPPRRKLFAKLMAQRPLVLVVGGPRYSERGTNSRSRAHSRLWRRRARPMVGFRRMVRSARHRSAPHQSRIRHRSLPRELGLPLRHGHLCHPAPRLPPAAISTNHPPNQRLPGASNMSFWDGHIEQVKVDHLWNLSWHRNYKPPPKRPGL